MDFVLKVIIITVNIYNFKGICINDKCIAYGKDMIYNIGCGELSFN